MSERTREIEMMIRQLNEGTDSVFERQGMCLSGIGSHTDFTNVRTMHAWLSGAVAMMDWHTYSKEVCWISLCGRDATKMIDQAPYCQEHGNNYDEWLDSQGER